MSSSEGGAGGVCLVDVLPCEMLVDVMLFLEVPFEVCLVSQVSQYLRAVALSPAVWKVLNLQTYRVVMKPQQLETLMMAYPEMSHLSLRGCKNESLFKCSWGYLRKLTVLDLGHCSISNQHFIDITKICTQLKSINVEYTPNIRDSGILSIAQHSINLEKLNISNCAVYTSWNKKFVSEISANSLREVIIFRGAQLIHLNVANQVNIKNMDLMVLKCLAEFATNLQALNLSVSFPDQTDPTPFSLLLSRNTTLTSLIISDLGFDYTPLLSQHCTNLQSFQDQSNNRFITPQKMQQLIPHLSHLKQLKLSGKYVDDAVLGVVGQTLKDLVSLSVPMFGAKGVNAIKALENCRFLRRLDIRTQFGDFCKSDETIIPLTRRCSMLDYLDLGKTIIDDAMGSISDLKALKCLYLTPIQPIKKASLLYFAENCCNLREFRIPWTSGIDDQVINVLALHCPFLSVIEWHKMDQKDTVTGKSLEALGRNCRQLEMIIMGFATPITDDAVVAIADGCPLLSYLSLSYCDELTPTATQTLKTKANFLEYLEFTSSEQPPLIWGAKPHPTLK